MGKGIRLRTGTGKLIYSSAAEDGDFFMVLDAIRVHSSETGSKQYSETYGGNLNNLEWLQMPDDPNNKMHEITHSGTGIAWQPTGSGQDGYSTIIVSIR